MYIHIEVYLTNQFLLNEKAVLIEQLFIITEYAFYVLINI